MVSIRETGQRARDVRANEVQKWSVQMRCKSVHADEVRKCPCKRWYLCGASLGVLVGLVDESCLSFHFLRQLFKMLVKRISGVTRSHDLALDSKCGCLSRTSSSQ